MSVHVTYVDGEQWVDGSIGVDADGKPWRLTFVASDWGPAHDAWFWQEFGLPVDHVLGSPAVKLPLTRIWPQEAPVEEEPKPKRRPTPEREA